MSGHVGFTGTQRGMTAAQKATVAALLRELSPAWVHHGDCVGADAEFHELATAQASLVCLHPPSDDRKRAFCEAPAVQPPQPYLVRNAAIVADSDVLIATPGASAEELRSGTWATVRRARKRGIEIRIVWPDGTGLVEGRQVAV